MCVQGSTTALASRECGESGAMPRISSSAVRQTGQTGTGSSPERERSHRRTMWKQCSCGRPVWARETARWRAEARAARVESTSEAGAGALYAWPQRTRMAERSWILWLERGSRGPFGASAAEGRVMKRMPRPRAAMVVSSEIQSGYSRLRKAESALVGSALYETMACRRASYFCTCSGCEVTSTAGRC